MSLPTLSANRPAAPPPFAGLDIGKSFGKNADNGLAKALAGGNSVTDAPSGSRFGLNQNHTDQVQLSGQGQALQALDASGQDVQAEADILGKLTRQSLTYLVPDAKSAKISFDSLSFSSSSSTSFSQVSNGDGVASVFHSEQQGSLVGHGHITTADGRDFEFDAELDISSSTDISQVIQGGGNPSAAGQRPVPAANGNTGFTGIGVNPNARFPGPAASGQPSPGAGAKPLGLQDFIAASDRLLDLLQQTNPASGNANGASNAAKNANPAEQLVKDLLAQLQKPVSATPLPAQDPISLPPASADADSAKATGANGTNANTARAIQNYQ